MERPGPESVARRGGGDMPFRKGGNRPGRGAVGRGMRTEKKPVSAAMVLVSLRWNGEPLVTRTARGGEVVLGDAKDAIAPLPEEALGARALVIADVDGGAHVRVPEGKVAAIARRARDAGDAQGSAGGGVRLVAGPERVALRAGDEATILLGAFEVTVAAHANDAPKKGRRLTAGAWVHTAMVAAVHAALLFAGSRAALASSVEASGQADVEQIRGYLAASEERSSSRETQVFGTYGKEDEMLANGRDGNGEHGGGERHAGEAGKAGSTTSRAVGRRWGAAPKESAGAGVTAAEEIEAARTFGMVGVLGVGQAAAARMEGTSPWGANDPFTAMGGMLGHVVGQAEGSGGLALSGTGEGGGGRGEGLGLGTIGTIGHADGLAGRGTGGAGTKQEGVGFGWIGSWSHWGRLPASHRLRAIRYGGWEHSVTGRLPPEAIQRIVRANFGRFRACYNDGLQRNPGLTGRVSVRFVIGRDGAVSTASDGGSDLPDAAVRACVVRAFYGLSFPQPEGGIVTVTYPIHFSTITDHR